VSETTTRWPSGALEPSGWPRSSGWSGAGSAGQSVHWDPLTGHSPLRLSDECESPQLLLAGSQFGVRLAFDRLRAPDAEQLLAARGVPAVWRRSIAEAVAIVRVLDERLVPIEQELRPLARADERVRLLVTIPGIGDLLGLTIASEIGDISRFASARKLVGYSGLTPRVYQSGQKSRTGKLSRTGSTMLRWAAIEAAQQAWRPNKPWHQLYLDVKERCGGKGNPAKAAVARKVLIASWHVLSLQQPFAPSRPRGATAPAPANSSCVLAD
jgi:transposase